VEDGGGREGREEGGGGGEEGIRGGGSRTHRPDPRPLRPHVEGTEATLEESEDNQEEVRAIQDVDDHLHVEDMAAIQKVHLHVEDMVAIQVEDLLANLEEGEEDSHEVDNQEEALDDHLHVEVEDMKAIRVEVDGHGADSQVDDHGVDSQEEGHTLHLLLSRHPPLLYPSPSVPCCRPHTC